MPINYYLDTNIFLTHLKQERDDIACLKEINNIFESIEARKYIVATSTITLVEVLAHKRNEKEYNCFAELIERDCIELHPVDMTTGLLAQKLRTAFYENQQGKEMTTPDAIHVASAVAVGVKYLLTQDGDILNLDSAWVQSVIGGNTQIIKPPIPRNQLWLPG